MTTQHKGSPVITENFHSVAGHQSMLLNLSGSHEPFFIRNIILLTDSASHTGVGEVPGREKSLHLKCPKAIWEAVSLQKLEGWHSSNLHE